MEVDKNQHESNKVIREHLAWCHYKLQHVPHIHEEDAMFGGAIKILEAICLDLQKKIELIEPPAPSTSEIENNEK